jgi:hypothetical protein
MCGNGGPSLSDVEGSISYVFHRGTQKPTEGLGGRITNYGPEGSSLRGLRAPSPRGRGPGWGISP